MDDAAVVFILLGAMFLLGLAADAIGEGMWEVGGALLIGGGLGAMMAYLTGRISKGEPSSSNMLHHPSSMPKATAHREPPLPTTRVLRRHQEARSRA